MCVKIFVTLDDHASYLGEIERKVQKAARVELHLEDPSTSVSSKPLVFSVAETDAGCGCSWVTDVTDWSSPVWRFKPDRVGELVNALKVALSYRRSSAHVSAVWLGPDRPNPSTESIQESALLRALEHDKIVPQRRYDLSSGA